MEKYQVIGLMSGTSLDGLDIALCEFSKSDEKWKYKILKAQTNKFSKELITKIQLAPNLSGEDLFKLHNEFGRFSGHSVVHFLEKNKSDVLIVASHGHTIFHQPLNSFTCQIGSGAEIAAITGIDTVCDFRTTDVAIGGQGAPLVPIGDELLFSEFDFCLNIGGIANISTRSQNQRVAWDICPANMILNFFANKINLEYDKDGEIAKSGRINHDLLEALIEIDFHKSSYPKSLGREYVFDVYLPIISKFESNINNILCTVVEMISILTKKSLSENNQGSIFVTGGGAFNSFLIERFREHELNIYLPDSQIISFKEALIFAFLGLLRKLERKNVLRTVTGSSRDSVSGAIYSGK